MIVRLVYFLAGAFVAALFCFNYFSGVIQNQSEHLKLVKKQSEFTKGNIQKWMSTNRAVFSEPAHATIKLNNTIVRNMMYDNPDPESVVIARTLLSSSLLLNDMTFQDLQIKEDLFLSTLVFFKKSSNEKELKERMPILIDSCIRNYIMSKADCNEKTMNELLATLK